MVGNGRDKMHDIAKRVINKCGGVRRVSVMIGVSTQSIYKWTYPYARGGTNGIIPAQKQIELMVAARRYGIDLRPDDFFPKMPPLGDGA